MPNSGVFDPGAETSSPSFLEVEIVRQSFFRWGMVNEIPSNSVPFHELLIFGFETAMRGFFSI